MGAPHSSHIKITAVFIFVTIFSFFGIATYHMFVKAPPYTFPWESDRPNEETKAACLVHVADAEQQAQEAIKRRATEFSVFVDSRKAGADAFSREMTSFYGKWRAAKPYLPFTKEDSHQEYIAEIFAKHIFSQKELANAMLRSISGSLKDIEGIENNLAIALRQEILGRPLNEGEYPLASKQFKSALDMMAKAANWDAKKTAANMVVSEALSFIATQIFIRLGVSVGILATGVANSWWSLGASVIIGLIVDAVWEWVDDPAGDIEREMEKALQNLSVNGRLTIVSEMSNFLTDRSGLWSRAIQEGAL